jgi:hypothetical protein
MVAMTRWGIGLSTALGPIVGLFLLFSASGDLQASPPTVAAKTPKAFASRWPPPIIALGLAEFRVVMGLGVIEE